MRKRKLLCRGHYCYPKRIRHDAQDLTFYHHRNFCDKCLNYLKQTNHNRKALYREIEQDAYITFPTGRMLKNIKSLKNDRHYTYRGMLYSLQYIKATKKNFNFQNSGFINYIPYIYEVAQRWKYNLHPVQQEQYDQKVFTDARLGEIPRNDVTKVVIHCHKSTNKHSPNTKKFDFNKILD